MLLPTFKKLLYKITHAAPALLICAVALIIAWKNIIPGTHYAGWDNILAELDLGRYARQVFFGAWVEHQSLGAPAAQGHLSEIPRLPILFLINLLFPANLVRYIYIFGTYLIGGLSIYAYLRWYWFNQYTTKKLSPLLANWLSGLGGILYLLHVLTLQQFYISFEMFMAQFAFLPVVLIAIHKLFPVTTQPTKVESVTQQIKTLLVKPTFSHKTNVLSGKQKIFRHLLLFIGVQFLIAPSGHTPTIFYLAVLFTQLYGFMMHLPKGIFQATKVAFLIGLLTFVANAYWIVPNLYYSVHNSHYVSDSRNNRIFGPESLWAIKEAGTFDNFLKGTHYLFNWKDYSFANQQFDFIFNEWESHLSQPSVIWIMRMIGLVTIAGACLIVFSKSTSTRKWAYLLTYIGCVLFIFVDLFPTKYIFDFLYQYDAFLEAFRNPFTKLSIIYSFVSVVLFVEFFRVILSQKFKTKQSLAPIFIIAVTMLAIVYTALPSFQGNFISEKLRITFPEQYNELYAFMKTQDPAGRVLQLPQHSHAGWEYYDWQFMYPGNGYQGMGFYFFGFPQSFLNRDSDRWVETSDFFYHELKYTIDTGNPIFFNDVLHKYSVDYLILDETKIDPNRPISYSLEKKLIENASLELIWQKDFLHVYRIPNPLRTNKLLIPESVTSVSANTDRVRFDSVYKHHKNYVVSNIGETQEHELNSNSIIYPFANLATPELSGITFTDQSTIVTRSLSTQNEASYLLSIPAYTDDQYYISTAIALNDLQLSISYPQIKLVVENNEIKLPQIENQIISLADFETGENVESLMNAEKIVVFFNDIGVVVKRDELALPTIAFNVGNPIRLSIAPLTEETQVDDQGFVITSELNVIPVKEITVDWPSLTQEKTYAINLKEDSSIAFHSIFPSFSLDLDQNPSINCSSPTQGSIDRIPAGIDDGFEYIADTFGVNCNGYAFEYVSPAGEYVMRIAGKNNQGRGTKLFLNYLYPRTMPEDYLMRKPEFDLPIAVHSVSNDVQANFHLNWETRSFGKESSNELERIELRAMPLSKLAGISIREAEPARVTTAKNELQILDTKSYLDTIHIVKINCTSQSCWLGLNQSYDSGWFGFSIDNSSVNILPHSRLNNWANSWELPEGERQVILMYIPELVQMILFYSLIFGSTCLLIIVLTKLRPSITSNT